MATEIGELFHGVVYHISTCTDGGGLIRLLLLHRSRYVFLVDRRFSVRGRLVTSLVRGAFLSSFGFFFFSSIVQLPVANAEAIRTVITEYGGQWYPTLTDDV
jgi:hypothetical protein